MARQISETMYKTLEALEAHSGMIGRGTTAGEVVAAGGSTSCLYSAVKKGWANRYAQTSNWDADNDKRVPKYWRTDEGTSMFESANPLSLEGQS